VLKDFKVRLDSKGSKDLVFKVSKVLVFKASKDIKDSKEYKVL